MPGPTANAELARVCDEQLVRVRQLDAARAARLRDVLAAAQLDDWRLTDAAFSPHARWLVVHSPGVRVRREPHVDAAVVGVLRAGELVDTLPAVVGGWARCVAQGGWVRVEARLLRPPAFLTREWRALAARHAEAEAEAPREAAPLPSTPAEDIPLLPTPAEDIPLLPTPAEGIPLLPDAPLLPAVPSFTADALELCLRHVPPPSPPAADGGLAASKAVSRGWRRVALALLSDAAWQAATFPLPSLLSRRAPAAAVRARLALAPHEAAAPHGRRLPLHLAAACAAPLETIDALARAHPAALSAADLRRLLPLHLAARAAAPDGAAVCRRLCGGGALLLHQSKERKAALHEACEAGAPVETVRALLGGGEAARLRARHERLPLHLAAAHGGGAAVCRALLDAFPAAARARDRGGELPVHLAVRCGAADDVVELLLEAYAVDGGWACVDLLRLRRRGEAALWRRLVDEPWQAMAADAERRVALHHAAICQASADVVELLLAIHPAAARQQDIKQNLPLHYAMMHRLPEVPVIENLVRAYPASIRVGFGDRPWWMASS